MRILQSASKIVLLLFAFTACSAFLAVVLRNVSSEQVVNAVTTIFTTAVGSAMTYYFTKQGKPEDQPK